MIPGALLRLLPQIGLALGLVAALWWIDHRGYARAMIDRDRRDAAMLDRLQSELRRSEQHLAMAVNRIADDHDRMVRRIVTARAAAQPLLTQEIAREPRLADPASGLTPGLLDAVNRARALGACAATASGELACALPPAPADR